MKKSRNKNPNARVRRNPVLVFIIIILITIIALGASIYLSRRPFRDSDDTDTGQSVDIPDESEKKPQEDITEPEESPDENLDGPIQYEGDNPNKSDILTGIITTARVSGNVALIRVSIDQYLTSGTCTINLRSNAGKVYSETAKVSPSASTSTCEGFNIPVSSLGSGTWTINISISSGDKQGNIIGEINI